MTDHMSHPVGAFVVLAVFLLAVLYGMASAIFERLHGTRRPRK